MITAKVNNASVKNAVKIFYDIVLNGLREAEIYADGSDSTLRSEYAVGNTVYIYKDGTLEFQGQVIKRRNHQGGGVVMYAIGQEEELTEQDCPVTGSTHSKVWTSTGENTIFNDIVTETSGWSTDTTGSTNNSLDSFKVTDSMSVWNGMQKFRKTTGKDFYIDDASKTVYLVDSKNRTNKAVFNEGQNCSNITESEGKAKASKVIVYGKGDGDNQFVGSSGSGTPVKKIIDRTIISTAEANTRAAAELALIQNNIYHYTFNCYNPNENVETGDTVVLNAPSVGVFNSSVDITKIRRTLARDKEKLSLEVSDTNSREAKENLTQTMYKQQRNYELSQSSMQGQRSLMPIQNSEICDSSNPLALRFYVPSSYITDEAGTNRVKEVLLNYSLKNYKKIVDTTEDVTVTAVGSTSANTVDDTQQTTDSTVDDTQQTTANRLDGTTANTANRVDDTQSSNYYTEINSFANVEQSNMNDHNHDVASTTSNSSTTVQDEGSDSGSISQFNIGWNTSVCSEGASIDGFVHVIVDIAGDGTGSAGDMVYRVQWNGSTKIEIKQADFATDGQLKNEHLIYVGLGQSSIVDLDIYSENGAGMDAYIQVYDVIMRHDHDIPSQSGGSSTGAEDRQVLLQKTDSSNFQTDIPSQTTDSLNDGDTKSSTVYSVVDSSDTTVDNTSDTKDNRVDNTSDTKDNRLDGINDTTANRITATILDLTEVVTSATGIKLYIDSTNRTNAVFGADPHNQTEDEDIDITDYVDTAGWHLVEIYPQGDKAFTIADIRVDHELDN